MPRFVLLLRGVNVGRGNRLPMVALKAILESLGCTEVKTLLNSGNAVFRSQDLSATQLAASVGAAIRTQLQLSPTAIVKSAAELSTIVRANPMQLPAEEHARFLVAFAPDRQTLQHLHAIEPLVQAPERLVIGDEAAYLHCPNGLLQSKAGEALLGKAGKGMTTRNWATVLKLEALVTGAGDLSTGL